MKKTIRICRLCISTAILWMLSACSTLSPTSIKADTDHWQGRLSVKVYSSPIQSIVSEFDLQGTAQEGVLVLSTPLGNTLATFQWNNQSATLTTPHEHRVYSSLSEMVVQASGTEIPIAQLFDWLHNIPTKVKGWEADLSDIETGKLLAHRTSPAPATELKLILLR